MDGFFFDAVGHPCFHDGVIQTADSVTYNYYDASGRAIHYIVGDKFEPIYDPYVDKLKRSRQPRDSSKRFPTRKAFGHQSNQSDKINNSIELFPPQSNSLTRLFN